jgi:hypothetical protein
MRTLQTQGRAITLKVDRRDLAAAMNRYFSAPFFLNSANVAMLAGRAS